MRKREIVQFLIANGFWLVDGKKSHDFYTNGSILIPVSKGSKQNPRQINTIKARLRNNSKGISNYATEHGTDSKVDRREVSSKKA